MQTKKLMRGTCGVVRPSAIEQTEVVQSFGGTIGSGLVVQANDLFLGCLTSLLPLHLLLKGNCKIVLNSSFRRFDRFGTLHSAMATSKD